jgi:hypothetical protein
MVAARLMPNLFDAMEPSGSSCQHRSQRKRKGASDTIPSLGLRVLRSGIKRNGQYRRGERTKAAIAERSD